MDKQATLAKIGKGSLVVLIGIVGANFLGLFKEIYLARFLGANDYGLFSLAFSIFLFLSILSLLGFQNGLVYFISSNLKAKNSYIKIALKYSLLTSVIISLLVIVFNEQFATVFNNPKLSELLIFFGLAIPMYVLLNISVAIARGHKDLVPKVLFFDIGQLFLFILFFLISSYIFEIGLKGVVFSFLLSYFLSSIISAFFVNKRYYLSSFWQKKNNFSTDIISKNLFSYSWPIYLSSFFQQIVSRGSLIILGLFLTENIVGVFTASQRLAFFINTPLSVLIPIFFPVITELISSGEDQEADIIYRNISKWLVLITLPFFLFAIFFPELIIELVFGGEYLSGLIVLRLILMGSFFGIFAGPIHNFLMSYRKTKLILLNTVVSAVINIGLSVILIPIYGLTGAGIAVAFSIIFNNLLGLIEYYLIKSKILIPQSLTRIFILGLVISLLFYFVSILTDNFYQTILALLFVLVAYYPTIKKIGLLDKTDKYLLGLLKNKIRGYLKKT